MTLIITTGCPEYVLQVSDRRISLRSRPPAPQQHSVLSDERNKELVVRSSDSDFAVSFTGLAQIAGMEVGDWLVETLNATGAARRGLHASADAIRESANEAFRKIARDPQIPLQHTFAIAGFLQGADRPTTVLISNCMDADFLAATPTPTFEIQEIASAQYPYHADGCTSALHSGAKARITGIIRRSDSPAEVIDLVVREIRAAAADSTYGKYIGQECMAICITAGAKAHATYHPTHADPRSYSPNFIQADSNAGMSISGVTVFGGAVSYSLGDGDGKLSVQDRRTSSIEQTRAVIDRGVAAGRDGRHEAALRDFDLVLANEPENQEARYNRAAALCCLGRSTAALSAVDDLLERAPDSARAHGLRGWVLRKLGQHGPALEALERSTESDASDPDTWRYMGVTKGELGRLQDALDDLNQAIALRPDHTDSLYNRAVVYMYQGRYVEANADFDSVLELRHDHFEALGNRGNALQHMARYDDALADYNRALDLRPDDANTLMNRGAALDHLERYDDALADYNRALDLRPNDADTLMSRGVAYINLKRYDDALADLNRALDLRPGHAGTLYNRACMYSVWSKADQALTDLRWAIDGDTKLRDMARTDSDFDNIRSDPRFQELVGEESPPPEGAEG